MAVVIRNSERRRTETPNAVMTTHASPTLGESSELSMWQVQMKEGSRGPVHRFDSEQIVTVLDGRLEVTVDGQDLEIGAGDTVVLPSDSIRQIYSPVDSSLLACGHGRAHVYVPGEDGSRGTPDWIS